MWRLISLAAIIIEVSLGFAQERPVIQVDRNGMRIAEPGWRCGNPILNRPPGPALSERLVVVSSCEHDLGNGKWRRIDVRVFQVSSGSDAALALSPMRDKKVAAGWSVTKIQVGDEAYLSTFRNGRQFEIHFRADLNVVEVSSDSLALVKRVAQEVASHLPLK